MPLQLGSIKARLVAAFLSVVLLFGLAGIVATATAHLVRTSVTGPLTADDTLIQHSLQARRLLVAQHAAIRGYLLTESPALLWPYSTANRSLSPIRKALANTPVSAAVGPLRAEVDRLIDDWQTWARQVIRRVDGDEMPMQLTRRLDAGERLFHRYTATTLRLLHTLRAERSREIQRSAGLLGQIRVILLAIFACATVLAALLWLWMIRAVMRPLADLRHAAETLGGGNFSRPVRARGPSEFRALSESMEQMRRQINTQYAALHGLNRALHVSETRFRAMVDRAAIGVTLADAQGRYVATNPAFQRMTGYTGEELLGLGWPQLTHPDDVRMDLCANDRLYGGLVEDVHREKRYLRKDGSVLWVRIVASLIRDADDRPDYTLAMVEDITEQHQAEEALRAREAEFREMHVGVLIFDGEGRVIRGNPAVEAMLATSAEDMRGRTAEHSATPLLREDYTYLPPEETPIARAIATGQPVRNAVVGVQRPDTGERVWLLSNAEPLLDASGKVERVICTMTDITERRRLEEQLRHLALHDALTGLPNRCLLHDRLDHAIAAAHRRRVPVSLLLLDLDRFKEVNDTFGHRYGDLLLQQLSERLQDALRGSDTLARLAGEGAAVARLGGDEFATVLLDTPIAGAQVVAQKILEHLREPFSIEGEQLDVSASIGIACYPEHGGDAETLLRHADVAMYVAKRERGGYAVYNALDDPYNPVRAGLIRDLRLAIEHDALMLHFQPKADLATGRVVGVEGLVRWQHPTYGWVPPPQIIALAEHTGLIKELTAWVLRAAVQHWREWWNAGLELTVQVNLSARSLHDPQLVTGIAKLLDQHAMPAHRLGVEITESSVMADPERALRILKDLDSLGISISIDDFGTGYSSLRYLKDLPADEVKIDRSFVSDVAGNEHDLRIVRGTIALAHDLGLRTVAEGIEDEDAWNLLHALGCDQAQGYYLARPMPAEALCQWLRERPMGSVA